MMLSGPLSFDDAKVRHSESVSTTSHVLLRTLTFFHAIIGYGVFRCLARVVKMPCASRSDALHTYMEMPSTIRGRHSFNP